MTRSTRLPSQIPQALVSRTAVGPADQSETRLCYGTLRRFGCRLYEYYDPLAVLWLKWMLRVGLWCVFSWLNLPRHGSCEVQGITVTG